MIKSKMEKELEKNASELDTYLLKMKVGWFLLAIGGMLFYGFIVFKLYYDKTFILFPLSLSIHLSTYLILVSFSLPVFVGMFLISPLSDRKLVSYTLYKIAEGLKKRKLNEKYLRLLYRQSTYDMDEVKEEDHIFEKDILIHQKFKKCLNEFALGLNHAVSTNSIDKLDSHLIKNVAVSVYTRKGDLIGLAGKLSKMYLERRKFPTIYDYFRELSHNKWILFIVLESVLIVVLSFIYSFFVHDINTAAIGFFTITPGIMIVVFK